MRFALALLALSAACSKPKEIDCGAAGRAWAELVHHQLESDRDPARQEQANAVVPALREALVKRCVEQKWPVAARRCIANAKSADELERCNPGGAAAPTAAPATEPAAAPATAPAP